MSSQLISRPATVVTDQLFDQLVGEVRPAEKAASQLRRGGTSRVLVPYSVGRSAEAGSSAG
jgi:hypothetical protein